jgi:hypothetical protein
MSKWTQTQYPNYAVNSQGEVQNISTGKVLNPSASTNGYKKVTVFDANGNPRTVEVHRLIAETLIPNSDPSLVVDHIDCNVLNNDISNLRWISRGENRKRSTKKSVRSPALTDAQREEVKDMYAQGVSLINITKIMNSKYDCSRTRATYTKVVR